PSVLALTVIVSDPPLPVIVRSTACWSTLPVKVPSFAHGVPLRKTVEDARLPPFCTIMKSKSKLVGPSDEVVSACQFPDTLAFPPGRLSDESSPHPTRKPAHAKTAQILRPRIALLLRNFLGW